MCCFVIFGNHLPCSKASYSDNSSKLLLLLGLREQREEVGVIKTFKHQRGDSESWYLALWRGRDAWLVQCLRLGWEAMKTVLQVLENLKTGFIFCCSKVMRFWVDGIFTVKMTGFSDILNVGYKKDKIPRVWIWALERLTCHFWAADCRRSKYNEGNQACFWICSGCGGCYVDIVRPLIM